jgi:hypothetical protein
MPTIAPVDITGHCVHAGFISNVPVFASADGQVYRLEGKLHESLQHDGLLCAAVERTAKSPHWPPTARRN